MRTWRLSTLQWAIGGFCAFIGTLMLLSPHQFNGFSYRVLQGWLPVSGTLCVFAGGMLISIVLLKPQRLWMIVGHALAASALLVLAYGFLVIARWTGAVIYSIFGVGTLLAALLPQRRHCSTHGHDVFTLLLSLTVLLNGTLFLTAPEQFTGSVYVEIHPYLTWLGIAYVLAGSTLAFAALHPHPPRFVVYFAHLLCGSVLLTFCMTVSLPHMVWTGIAFNGGFGLLIAVLPWLRPQVQHFDRASLRSRFALALALAAALPLLLNSALTASRTAQVAQTQALGAQETLALTLAHDVANYVNIHRTTVAALAAQPDLLTLRQEQQMALLDATNRALPDAYAFSLVDAAGMMVARSNTLPLHAIANRPAFRKVKQTNQPMVEVQILTSTQRPAFIFMTPIHGPDGAFAGLVGATLESPILTSVLTAGAGTGVDRAYLVDDQGRAIAHPDTALVASFANLAHLPPVAALLADADGTGSGSLPHTGPAGNVLASYARVPTLGWGVVVEQPAAVALASTRLGQDTNFGVFLLVIVVAGSTGALAARRLTAPLASLSAATSRLTMGQPMEELPHSGVTEVAQLAAVFGELSDQLTIRTAQRAAAEAHLQFLADASVQLSSSLEYEATLDQVARLAVSFFADVCLVDVVNADDEIERAAAVHRDGAQQALVDGLRPFAAHRRSVSPLADVLRTGRSCLLNDVNTRSHADMAGSEEQRGIIEQLEITSMLRVPMVARGRVLGVITFVATSGRCAYTSEDVRLAEELVRRAALAIDNARLYREAQAAIKARDEFLSIASHEFKTPITALLGQVHLMERRARRDGNPDSRVQKSLQALQEQAGRLQKLIGLLLDVSRIGVGQFLLDRESLDLRMLVKRVVTEITPMHERHTIHLDIPEIPVVIDGDELRLEQVVQNVVGNAIKYSPEGGAVSVRVSQAVDSAVLTIQDQGIGIPEAAQARLFQRFYRASNVNPSQISGFGVGLYLVQEIVTAHDGSVEVVSEEGRGSTFTIRLPLMETLRNSNTSTSSTTLFDPAPFLV